jgi:hypothetical protein
MPRVPKPRPIFDRKKAETEFDRKIIDDAGATFDYFCFARRADLKVVTDAGLDPLTQPIWYIYRKTKVTPYDTQAATAQYDQIYNDRAALTYI